MADHRLRDWNTVAAAGLLNPVPPVGRGLGFVPLSAVIRPGGTDFGRLHYQLARMGHHGLILWWKITRRRDDPEYPTIDPIFEWCGRGRDPRPWPARLRAWWSKTALADFLDWRFGPLTWTREGSRRFTPKVER